MQQITPFPLTTGQTSQQVGLSTSFTNSIRADGRDDTDPDTSESFETILEQGSDADAEAATGRSDVDPSDLAPTDDTEEGASPEDETPGMQPANQGRSDADEVSFQDQETVVPVSPGQNPPSPRSDFDTVPTDTVPTDTAPTDIDDLGDDRPTAGPTPETATPGRITGHSGPWETLIQPQVIPLVNNTAFLPSDGAASAGSGATPDDVVPLQPLATGRPAPADLGDARTPPGAPAPTVGRVAPEPVTRTGDAGQGTPSEPRPVRAETGRHADVDPVNRTRPASEDATPGSTPPNRSGDQARVVNPVHPILRVPEPSRPAQPVAEATPERQSPPVESAPNTRRDDIVSRPVTQDRQVPGAERQPFTRPATLANQSVASGHTTPTRMDISEIRQPRTLADQAVYNGAPSQNHAASAEQVTTVQSGPGALAARLGFVPPPNVPFAPSELSPDRPMFDSVPIGEARLGVEVSSTRAPADAAMQRTELPRHIASQLTQALQQSGNARSVELSLNPAELGRVRMALQTSENAVMVHITADRPETLDLMRRHADILARDFQEIGYQDAQLSFSQERSEQGQPTPDTPHFDGDNAAGFAAAQVGEIQSPRRLTLATDRVDIRV